jgi:hypothetical protein
MRLLIGAMLGGLIGLAAGLALPFITMPAANQGPLWVFITAPLGAGAGVYYGCKFAARKRREPPA